MTTDATAREPNPEPNPELSTGSTPELTALKIVTSWHATAVTLSRDGARVAWSAAPYGRDGEHPESGIWVADLAASGGGGAPVGRRWTRGGDDTRPAWSPDGARLAFLSDRAVRGTAGLYVVDADGGEAEPVAVRARSIGAFAWSPDSSTLAFLAPDDPTEDDTRRERERDDADVFGRRWRSQRLFTVPAAGGDPVALTGADAHAVALVWRPDGAAIALLVTPTPELDAGQDARVVVVDVATGGPTQVCALPWANDLRWIEDGAAVVVLAPHERVPQSSTTVWRVGAEAGATPAVFGPGPAASVCAEALTTIGGPGGVEVVLTVADGLGSRLQVWRDRVAEAPLWSADCEVAAGDVVRTAGGPVLVVVAGLDGGLPEVWAGPPEALRRLSDHHAPWAGVVLGAPEALRCEAVDALALDAVLIRPVGGGPAPWPTVVLPHGGPYGRYALGVNGHPLDWGQWLATAGYAVLLPNYRGGSGRGNAFATAVRGDLGGAEWGDVTAIVDAAVARGIADPARLGIAGWSQGGFLTAWGVTATGRFGAAVMGAGVSHWPSMALTGDVPAFEGALAGAFPWDGSGSTLPDARSPLTFAKRITTPLLMVHGERDERVPVSQAVGMFRALRGGPVPVELVTYPREPHVPAERRHCEDILDRVREWFTRHLPVTTGG